ncbi:unnamed protein product [Hapterophycus canaliculatus]
MLSSLARSGPGLARAAQRAAAAAPHTRVPAAAAARRSMGGHARNIGVPGEHVPIEVSKVYKNLGTVYLTTMFLWMLYRAKEDGLVVLGFEHPWDHMHDHDDHAADHEEEEEEDEED